MTFLEIARPFHQHLNKPLQPTGLRIALPSLTGPLLFNLQPATLAIHDSPGEYRPQLDSRIIYLSYFPVSCLTGALVLTVFAMERYAVPIPDARVVLEV